MSKHDLDRLFYPRGIAVIGASDTFGRGSSMFLRSLIDLGYEGGLYPVNVSANSTAMGLPAFKRVVDIPGPVDYAIVGVPAKATLGVVADCIEKGVPYIHFFTAGFTELQTEEGARLERELVELARGKTRLIGPNCMGAYCAESRIGFDSSHTGESGDVAFISQSGGHAINFIRRTGERGLKLSKGISYGNACDLSSTEFLEYFADDEKTAVIGIYIEGTKDGRKFFETLKAAAKKKPVIIWKGGRTPDGANAAASHSGALAGAFEIWRSMIKQAGAILVDDDNEMLDLMLGLKHLSLPAGVNTALVTTGGGNSVVAADECDGLGLNLPPLSEDEQRELLTILPEAGTIRKNPVDSSGHGLMPQNILKINEIVASDPNIDCIIFAYQLYFLIRNVKRFGFTLDEAFEVLTNTWRDVKNSVAKPVALVITRDSEEIKAEEMRQELTRLLLDAGVPMFSSVKAAALVLRRMNEFRISRER